MASEGSTRVPTVVAVPDGGGAPVGAPERARLPAGYVVDEVLLEGAACAYAVPGGARPPVDGRWEVEVAGEAVYRTRLLVVRPGDDARFNGTVLAQWQNVSSGAELGGPPAEAFTGYAWVGVSAQEIGLYGYPGGMSRRAMPTAVPLIERDPARYGTLHHPGDQGSFDIFTQAGRALRGEHDGAVDPLGGLDVRRLVALGGSQSAMRLVAYLDAVHPHAGVFDGFVLSVWEGRAPRPEEGAIAMGVRTGIRDQPTPVVVVNSEFEAPHLLDVPVHDTDHLRVWEVAGTPHGTARPRQHEPGRAGWVANPLSITPVYEAAVRAMHHWVAEGTPAPSHPRIAADRERGALLRDDDGNVRGGIRLPELAAPTHEYRGMAIGTGRAPLFGSARPLADDVVRARYRDRADHAAQWDAAVDALVASGALRPDDAPAMRTRAASVPLPFD